MRYILAALLLILIVSLPILAQYNHQIELPKDFQQKTLLVYHPEVKEVTVLLNNGFELTASDEEEVKRKEHIASIVSTRLDSADEYGVAVSPKLVEWIYRLQNDLFKNNYKHNFKIVTKADLEGASYPLKEFPYLIVTYFDFKTKDALISGFHMTYHLFDRNAGAEYYLPNPSEKEGRFKPFYYFTSERMNGFYNTIKRSDHKKDLRLLINKILNKQVPTTE